MNKWMIGYVWAMSILGAIFLGNEIAMIRHGMDREIANIKLQQCNKIVAGSIYEERK